MELDAGSGAWCGARILQCRAMPDLNAVQRESGDTGWRSGTTPKANRRLLCDPPKIDFRVCALLEQARTRRGCLMLPKTTRQPPNVPPES